MTKKIPDPIAAGIKKVIKDKGLVQKVVAKRAGLTSQQFSDMLNNRKVIKACDLIDITEAIGIEVAELFAACKPNTQKEGASQI